MYNKKYRLNKIEEFNKHNPIYDNMQGNICYLAYLNVGERGWFLHEDKDDWFVMPHRIHTSVIKNVDYSEENKVLVTTENTKFTFVVVNER